MKTLSTILILSLGILLAGCSKDNDTTPKFSAEFIYQTSWEGKLLDQPSNNINSYVGISFVTADRGSHRTDDGAYRGMTEFTYSVENNLITIKQVSGNSLLDGDWLVMKVEKNKLILRCETPEFILELNRVVL